MCSCDRFDLGEGALQSVAVADDLSEVGGDVDLLP